MAAMGPPGGGRTVISSRLQSRFNIINMTFPTVRTPRGAAGRGFPEKERAGQGGFPGGTELELHTGS